MTDSAAGRITVDLFTSLDWVAQAPGGPDEDPDGDFAYGGWQAPFDDEVLGAEVMAGIDRLDALLLGRRTYDIFAGYWPHHVDNPVGEKFARIPKYVVSRGTPELDWEGARLLGPDLAAGVAELRQRHGDVHVIGSIDLVQSLIAERLFDELVLWVHPILLGRGKKVFRDDTPPANLRLLAPPKQGSTGAVSLRYGPGDGEPQTGTVGPD